MIVPPPKPPSLPEAETIDALTSGTISSYVVSYAGNSQYSAGGGMSSCGLAAFNCARIILGKEQGGLTGISLLSDILKLQTLEEILQICLNWRSSSHLEVEDIYRTPVFRRSLKLSSLDVGQPSRNVFKTVLQQLWTLSNTKSVSTCAILTRPPEIVCCFYIFGTTRDVFVLFDSHPRPGVHPQGAGFVIKTTIDEMVEYLTQLFPFDNQLLEGDLQWEAQLLGSMSSHLFIARDRENPSPPINGDFMHSSLEILALKAELSLMKSEKDALAEENRQLLGELKRYKDSEASSRWSLTPFQRRRSGSNATGSSAGPSKSRSVPSQASPAAPSTPSTSTGQGRGKATGTRRTHGKRREEPAKAFELVEADIDSDLAFAIAQQTMYDEENTRLALERSRLDKPTSRPHVGWFKCGICFEKYSEEFVAKVSGCGHQFCRDCVRRYLETELESRKYPIFCPLCIVDGKTRSTLDNCFVQEVGLSEEQFALFIELELADFSIMIHCRSCQKSFFVDKAEVDGAKILTCPLPGCDNAWCKMCSQQVKVNGPGPRHTCDGSSELKHLMNEQGWKYCPGCQTPAEKISGCNHIMCTAPRCHTHYCYVCGKPIVKSTNRQEIQAAVQNHFSACKLFEEIPE